MRKPGLLLFLALAACGNDLGIGRSLVTVPDAKIVDVLVATTRNATDAPVEFGAERAAAPSFSTYRVSIPPEHQKGKIEWPEDRTPNPSIAFATLGSKAYGGQAGFINALNNRLAAKAARDRGVFLFVHGYNNSFAEALYMTAQIHADYEHPLVPMQFSWASAGRASLYAYDQDSALVARDDLAELLRALARSNASVIEIVGHSMGSFVVMEALRQLDPSDLKRLNQRMGNVTLLSPDLDPDVLASQLKAISPLPQPILLMTSKKDWVLRLSAFVRGGSRRAGLGEKDFERLEALGVTPLDITEFSDGANFNHTLFNNPSLIDLIIELMQDRRGRRANLAGLAQLRLDNR